MMPVEMVKNIHEPPSPGSVAEAGFGLPQQELALVTSLVFLSKDLALVLLVKINQAVNERLGMSLPLITMFEYPTIAFLSDYINKNVPETSPQESVRDRAFLQREALKKRRIRIE